MEKASGKKITILKNGPYEVSGNVPLNQAVIGANAEGESISWEKGCAFTPTEEPYHLCRCGRSKNKPYCDGTHEEIGFNGREHADQRLYSESADLQQGPGIDLLDDENLCAGARFCDVGKRVWGYVDASQNEENVQAAIREARNCPAGRLTAVDKNGTMIEPDLPAEISPVEDPVRDFQGPLWVKGGIAAEGANGETYEVRNRVTLCRCGESQNQPYCDGSHYACQHMQGKEE